MTEIHDSITSQTISGDARKESADSAGADSYSFPSAPATSQDTENDVPVLEVRKLSYSYPLGKGQRRRIFEDVSFSVHAGEVLTILGPNGAGKSTLLNCAANLLKPDAGEVLLMGTPIGQLDLRTAAKIMGYVPQTHTPAYSYTVLQFVLMGRAPHLGLMEKPGPKDRELAMEVLRSMHIEKLANKPYTQISGGERQQATIARAIVQQPKVLMFDEPSNHLDYGNQLRVINMIHALADKGFAIVLTSHIPDHVILVGGKVGILDPEGAFETGKTSEVLLEERLSRLYKTEVHIVFSSELGRYVCIAGRRECKIHDHSHDFE